MGEGISFSARFKKLTREYGWASLGIYLALGALDFPFCFLLVRAVGAQKIGRFYSWQPCKNLRLSLTWIIMSRHGGGLGYLEGEDGDTKLN